VHFTVEVGVRGGNRHGDTEPSSIAQGRGVAFKFGERRANLPERNTATIRYAVNFGGPAGMRIDYDKRFLLAASPKSSCSSDPA